MLPNPNANTPLVTFLEVRATEPVRVSVIISDGKNQRWEYQAPGRFKQDHRIPIFQLKPASDYEFTVTLTNTWLHRSKPAIISYRTLDWASNFPSFEIIHGENAKRRPGFHLLSMSKVEEAGAERGFLLAINWRGEVMWFWEGEVILRDLALHKDRLIVGRDKQREVIELDLLGNVLNRKEAEWYEDKEVERVTRNGNWLVLDKAASGADRLREVTKEPESQTVLELEATGGSRIHAVLHLPSLKIK